MLLTEKDASAVRCTPVIVILLMDPEQLHGRQAAGDGVVTTCIGSKCMQWRWYKPTPGVKYGPTPEEIAGTPQGGGITVQRGYCGLAGFVS